MPIDLNEHLNRRRGGSSTNGANNQKDSSEKSSSKGGGDGNGGGGGSYQPPLKTPEFFKNFSGKKGGVLYAVIIIVVLLFMTKPFIIINSGEVGIKVTAGKFDTNPLSPGIHFFLPVIQKVIIVDTKVRVINFSSTEDMGVNTSRDGIFANEAITVLDERGLPVSIELTIQYLLKPLSAPQTIATWGLSWEQKIINPVVRDVVRSVVGSFPAEELPTRRNEIASLVESEVRRKVDSLDTQPVNISSVQLREIVLPLKIKEQIERVQVARQETERTRYEVERAKQEAEKRAAEARGVAEAKRINAQGIADANIIEADAQAKANRLVAESLTSTLLSLRQIEVQGKFNEALRVNKDAKIFLTPGGSVPNIWVDTKDARRETSIHNDKQGDESMLAQQNSQSQMQR